MREARRWRASAFLATELG